MYGFANIAYNGGAAAAASTFLTDADNGLSLSTIAAATAVLGQDIGQTGDPGKLLSDREIPLNAFGLNFLGSDLDTGIIAAGTFLQGGAISADGLDFWLGEPNNYLTTYPSHGEAGRFSAGWQRFDGVNTYPRPNVVGQFWAYNYNVGGSVEISGEAGFGFRTETDFDLNAGGTDYFELHLPEVAVPGLTFRPWSFYISKVTGATIHQSQVQNYNFNTKNDDLTYFSWSATTTGGPPNTDRTLTFNYSALGTNAIVRNSFVEQNNAWAAGDFTWDRGSLTLGLDAGNPNSWNGKTINLIGNVRQTGAGTGASIISTFSQTDQLTGMSVQLISNTFANNPFFGFDRRGGVSPLPDGTNAGELTWNQGGRDMQAQGIANGTHSGGISNCFDFVINGLDTDTIYYNQLIVGRNGNLTARGSVTTGDPGAGAAAWFLGDIHAAAVTLDTTSYVEAKIGGTVVKLAIVN